MKNMWNWFLQQSKQTQRELVLLIVFAGAFILGQLGRIAYAPIGVFYPHDFLILLWLLFHYRSVIKIIRNVIRWLPQHPLVVTTVIWVALGLIWGNLHRLELRALLLLSRVLIYTLFAASVCDYFRDHRLYLRGALILIGNIMLWLALLQYLFIPDTRFLSILGWDDHYYRLIGTLFDPNFMGMLIVLTMIYTASVHWLVPKKAQVLIQSYYAALLALTYSRASYLTASMAGFLLMCTPYPLKGWHSWQRLSLVVVAALTFSVVLVVAPKPGGEGVKLLRTSSIVARQNTASQTFQNLSTTDLILGKGLFTDPLQVSDSVGEIVIPQHAQVPDNILLLLLSGTGVVGTILVLASVIYWVGQLAQKETALAIAVAATLLHAQFNNTFFEPFIFLFLLLAVLSPLEQTTLLHSNKKHFRSNKRKIVQVSK